MAATLERVVAPVEPDAPRPTTGTGRRVLLVVVLLVPALILLWGGWQRRWTADDGFINLRIVRQVVEGHGPVFNVGQRVETGTSPAWIAVLSVLDLLVPLRLEWIAALTGLGSTVAALVLAVFGTRRALVAIGVTGTFLPLGALVYAVLPPAWDFATSGLEVGLALLWLALCWWFLSARLGSVDRVTWYVPVVLGLGPVVRPDFAVFSVAFVVALVILCGRAEVWRIVAWAAAVPVVTELARMAYFASLVPNTALAKEASLSYWSQGWRYLADFVGSYAIVIPVVGLALLGWYEIRRRPWEQVRPFAWLTALFVGGAALHALYVVKVGGDFMHARLLLPACFVALLPVGVVAVRGAAWLGVVAIAAWALFAAFVLRPPYSGPATHHGAAAVFDAASAHTGIADERLFYSRKAASAHPVTIDDYLRHDPSARAGRTIRRLAATTRTPVLVLRAPLSDRVVVPIGTGASERTVASAEALGVFAYAAGTDVDVIDDHGLADVLGAHQRLESRGRPGHEKVLPDVWAFARYAKRGAPPPPGATAREVEAARNALACGGLRQVVEHTSGPWSVGDSFGNGLEAIRSFGFRFPADPFAAEREACR